MKQRFSATLCFALCVTLLVSLSSCFLLKPLSNTDPDEVYGKLLSEFAILAEARLDGEDITAKKSATTKGLSGELFDSLKAVVSEAVYEDAAELGYAFRDLDGDGVSECFLMKNDGRLYALYAMKNGTPYLVESYITETCVQGVLLEDNRIFTYHVIKTDGKAVGSEYRYAYFKDGGMEAHSTYCVDYENDTAYSEEYGERRDFADKELYHIYDQADNYYKNFKTCSRVAGLWFRSVADEGVQPDTPAFDASSYDALLDTLTTMMPTIREFVYKDWLNREYDDRMAVESPEAYRLYNDLLYACGMHSGYTDADGNDYTHTLGYAYKDLNADGSDELFIMNEDSDLIALFTLRENTPVLLWRASDGSVSALDSAGQLLASRYANGNFTAMEYFAYKLTSEGELSTTAYLFGDEYIRKVMTNGKIHIVDVDTYRAEFKRVFDKDQGEIWNGAWNEDGKTLTFIPFE